MVIQNLAYGQWDDVLLQRNVSGHLELELAVSNDVACAIEISGAEHKTRRMGHQQRVALPLTELPNGEYTVCASLSSTQEVFADGVLANIQITVGGTHNSFLVAGVPVGGRMRAELARVLVAADRGVFLSPSETTSADGIGGWHANRSKEVQGETPVVTVTDFFVDTSPSMRGFEDVVTGLREFVTAFCEGTASHIPVWRPLEAADRKQGGIEGTVQNLPGGGSRVVLVTDIPPFTSKIESLLVSGEEIAEYFGGGCFGISNAAREQLINKQAQHDGTENFLEPLIKWLCKSVEKESEVTI
jgi:hypothetical protein